MKITQLSALTDYTSIGGGVIGGFETSAYKINGRTHYCSRITTLRQVSPGHFEGTTYHGLSTFHITGGKHAGGTSREWFLDWPPVSDVPFPCTSLVGALKIIETT